MKLKVHQNLYFLLVNQKNLKNKNISIIRFNIFRAAACKKEYLLAKENYLEVKLEM